MANYDSKVGEVYFYVSWMLNIYLTYATSWHMLWPPQTAGTGISSLMGVGTRFTHLHMCLGSGQPLGSTHYARAASQHRRMSPGACTEGILLAVEAYAYFTV
jgi:hypothetical protein